MKIGSRDPNYYKLHFTFLCHLPTFDIQNSDEDNVERGWQMSSYYQNAALPPRQAGADRRRSRRPSKTASSRSSPAQETGATSPAAAEGAPGSRLGRWMPRPRSWPFSPLDPRSRLVPPQDAASSRPRRRGRQSPCRCCSRRSPPPALHHRQHLLLRPWRQASPRPRGADWWGA